MLFCNTVVHNEPGQALVSQQHEQPVLSENVHFSGTAGLKFLDVGGGLTGLN